MGIVDGVSSHKGTPKMLKHGKAANVLQRRVSSTDQRPTPIDCWSNMGMKVSEALSRFASCFLRVVQNSELRLAASSANQNAIHL